MTSQEREKEVKKDEWIVDVQNTVQQYDTQSDSWMLIASHASSSLSLPLSWTALHTCKERRTAVLTFSKSTVDLRGWKKCRPSRGVKERTKESERRGRNNLFCVTRRVNVSFLSEILFSLDGFFVCASGYEVLSDRGRSERERARERGRGRKNVNRSIWSLCFTWCANFCIFRLISGEGESFNAQQVIDLGRDWLHCLEWLVHSGPGERERERENERKRKKS